MSTPKQHMRGANAKPGGVQLIVSPQLVQVVGRTIAQRGKQMFTIKLDNGQQFQVPGDWIGGDELAEKRFESYRDVIMRKDQERLATQEAEQRRFKTEMRILPIDEIPDEIRARLVPDDVAEETKPSFGERLRKIVVG